MVQPRRYELRLSPRAEHDLNGIDSNAFRRIDRRIAALSAEPRPRGALKLWADSYRIRVGDWRIIYVIDDADRIVVINRVVRRSEDTYRR